MRTSAVRSPRLPGVRLTWGLGVQFTQVFDGQHADVSVLRLEHALVAVNADDRAHSLSLVSQNHLGLWASCSDQTLHSSHIIIIMGNSYKALFSNSVCCPNNSAKTAFTCISTHFFFHALYIHAAIYHWQKLPQVSFLSWQNMSFVTTKVCLCEKHLAHQT